MSPYASHPSYIGALSKWQRARDVLAGEDAVKSATQIYLPRLPSQSDAAYAAYLHRASFFNATARTLDAYLGLIFRRAPVIKVGSSTTPAQASTASPTTPASALFTSHQRSSVHSNPPFDKFLDNADREGAPFIAYARDIASEVLTVGRAGTLIDFANAERYPYACLRSAENILSWRIQQIQGRPLLSQLVLAEAGPARHHDTVPLDPDRPADQIRVLKLTEARLLPPNSLPNCLHPPIFPNQPALLVEIWQRRVDRKPHTLEYQATHDDTLLWHRRFGPYPQSIDSQPSTRDSSEWLLVETIVPDRVGCPLPRIPFVFHGPSHSRPDIDRLPLADLIALNLDHYRLDADYKHGLHYTALPTAWVSGFDKADQLEIGSATAWVSELPGARAGFLEFTGQGLSSFERALAHDERLMAALGSRLLEDPKKVGETADAIELRQSAEHSTLAAIAAALSHSLSQVLRWAYWWTSTEPTPEDIPQDQLLVHLNTDFGTKALSSQDLQALVRAWQCRAISQDTLFDHLRKGQILPETRTNEEEHHLIEVGTSASPARASTPSPSNSDAPVETSPSPAHASTAPLNPVGMRSTASPSISGPSTTSNPSRTP